MNSLWIPLLPRYVDTCICIPSAVPAKEPKASPQTTPPSMLPEEKTWKQRKRKHHDLMPSSMLLLLLPLLLFLLPPPPRLPRRWPRWSIALWLDSHFRLVLNNWYEKPWRPCPTFLKKGRRRTDSPSREGGTRSPPRGRSDGEDAKRRRRPCGVCHQDPLGAAWVPSRVPTRGLWLRGRGIEERGGRLR